MEHTITIKKVIAGGKGLGLLADGMVAMAGGVLAGETVLVRELKAHRGFIEAELVRVLESSPARITPPCPYYGDCGGCDLQHGAYPAQLAIKREILGESLTRARLSLELDQPGPTLAAPEPFGYRHRVRLHLDSAGALGFHRSGSNQVVPIRRCLLATEPLNRIIAALADNGWGERLQGQVQALELIQCPASGRSCLVLEPRGSGSGAAMQSHVAGLADLADTVLIRGAKPGQGRPAGAEFAQEFRLLGLDYRLAWDHRCFFQGNARQNVQLLSLALAPLAGGSKPFTALDLFSGTGNFSIPLGLLGAQVTGVEHNRHSQAWAARNSRTCGLNTMRLFTADVQRQLKTLASRGEGFDCILLDPPRQGLGKAAGLLPQLAPERIISISCDPATLARDLALITAGGYRLTAITPVDMFPQTHHIESVAFLERN